MRAGAIWENFTAWVDKIFKAGKMDDEVNIYIYIYNYKYKNICG